MIKIFIPQSKGKVKTSARGFWRNAEGKIFYDYLFIKDLKFNYNYEQLNSLEYLKTKFNQECIAYKEGKVLKIFYSKDKIEILPHRIYKEVLRQDLKKEIKEALQKYDGCTIYNKLGCYFIEIFFK